MYNEELEANAVTGQANFFSILEERANKQEDVYLTQEEFMAIDFGLKEGEKFNIINDVLFHLTGVRRENPS